MKTVNITMQMPVIAGYEYTGEYRTPAVGEVYIRDGILLSSSYPTALQHPILKKKPWRGGYACGYFSIAASGRVSHEIESHSDDDQARYAAGNYYQTKEEAEKVAARVLAAYKGE